MFSKFLVPAFLFVFFAYGLNQFKGMQEKGEQRNLRVFSLSPERISMHDFLKDIRQNGFEVAGVDFEKNTVDVFSSSKLNSLSSPYKVIRIKNYEKINPDKRYINYETLLPKIQELAANHPNLVSYFSIGKTVENRDIWAIKISKRSDDKEKNVVFFNGMHHAREVMTPEVIFDIANNITAQYEKNERVKNWLSQVDVFLIPMVNPDGNYRVFNGQPMWRKNVKGGYGVDLNRNYPYRWSECGGSSGSTYSDQYRGDKPASEPETQAMVKFIEQIKPKYSISYHSYSELVLYPYSCEGENVPGSIGEKIKEIGTKLAALHERDSGNGTYKAGTSWELLYSVDGGDIDWMYSQVGTIPFVVELNSSENGFQPDYSKVQTTLNKVRKGWQYILDIASE